MRWAMGIPWGKKKNKNGFPSIPNSTNVVISFIFIFRKKALNCYLSPNHNWDYCRYHWNRPWLGVRSQIDVTIFSVDIIIVIVIPLPFQRFRYDKNNDNDNLIVGFHLFIFNWWSPSCKSTDLSLIRMYGMVCRT